MADREIVQGKPRPMTGEVSLDIREYERLVERSAFIEQIQNALQTLKSDAPTWKAAIMDRIEFYQQERLQPAQTPAIEELLRKQYEAGGTMNRALVSPPAQTPDRPSRELQEGTWPADCVQRAFVNGAKWWQFKANGSTAFPSEIDQMEDEAVKRYGKPVAQEGKA